MFFSLSFYKKVMAKKEKKIEVINQEVEVVTNEVETNKVCEVKKTLDDLSLMDLVYAENAVRSVCKKYENGLKSYDGTILKNGVDYAKFQTLTGLHNRIINKMEIELLKLL